MNREEKATIREMPHKYRPMGAWAYVGYSILYGIPFIGWLFLFVFALSGGNIARRSFARSYFLKFFLFLVFMLIVGFVVMTVFGDQVREIIAHFKELMEQAQQGMPNGEEVISSIIKL